MKPTVEQLLGICAQHHLNVTIYDEQECKIIFNGWRDQAVEQFGDWQVDSFAVNNWNSILLNASVHHPE